MKRILFLTLIVLHSFACDSTECGMGTHQDGDACVGSLPVPCGPGTEIRDGTCKPAEGGGGADCGVGTHLEGDACVPDLAAVGNAIRMLNVTLTEPANFAPLANSQLPTSFNEGTALLFVAVHALSPSNTRIYGGTGMATSDGSYILDPADPFEVPITITGSTFVSEPFTLPIHALSQTPILVLDTVMSGTIDDTGPVPFVTGGQFSGVLTPENAEAVFIDITSSTLKTLIEDSGAPPDVDYDESGSDESWTLAATFEYTPIWMF